MNNKSKLTAGVLNFFLPGLGLAYLAGRRWVVFGVLCSMSLLSLQLADLVGLMSDVPHRISWTLN